MSILQRMKSATLELRKAKHPLASLGQTLIGECEMIGKNAGREVTEAEVLARIKKFLDGVNDTIGLIKEPSALEGLRAEKEWLEGWMPQQMTNLELEKAIGTIKTAISAGPKDMGKVLALLKERFTGRYDGKAAATIAKAVLT
jgi:uncharacterized protein YqeY